MKLRSIRNDRVSLTRFKRGPKQKGKKGKTPKDTGLEALQRLVGGVTKPIKKK